MQSLKGVEGLWTLVTLSALLITIIFCANASAAAKKDGHDWCYKDASCDASHWSTGQCKSGKYQSPIDIKKTEKRETLTRLRFNKQYLETQDNFLIKNNGHTVQIQLNDDLSSKLMMDGDGLKGSYVFSQLHFHWGSHDDVGSEHRVNGTAYPAELHLVHYGSSYKGLGDAVSQKNPRALVVLGIFLELGGADNMALKPIMDAMKQAMDVTEKPVPIHANLNISSFLPSDLALFRYYGSLTTPTCNEVVHWNVFRKTITISRSQLDAFRATQDGYKAKLVDNYRPPLSMSGRKVLEFEKVVMDPLPESGTKDESKPEEDSSDDFNEIYKSIEGKQESTTKKSSNSAASSKLQSFSVVAAFTSVAISVLMRFHH